MSKTSKLILCAALACATLLTEPLVAPVGGASAFAQGLGRVDIGAKAPDFELIGADGRRHALRDYRGKVVVLEWTSPVCPYTKAKYDDGTMQKLQKTARAQGVVWLSVNTSASGKPGYLTRERARARVAQTKAIVTAFLLDDGGRIGRLYGARATPSFFIIGKDGRLAYQGAIDDDQLANGTVTRNYVQTALEDLSASRPMRTAETRPYGCAVEY